MNIPGEIEFAACGKFNFLPGERALGLPRRPEGGANEVSPGRRQQIYTPQTKITLKNTVLSLSPGIYISGRRAWASPRLVSQHAFENLAKSEIFNCRMYIHPADENTRFCGQALIGLGLVLPGE